MTIKEAVLTLNANVVIACGRAGFDSATVKMIEDALDTIEDALKTQEPPTSTSISSAIECLLHPQDADDSDMAKAIDTAVRAMRLLKAQEPRVMTLEEAKALKQDIVVWYEHIGVNQPRPRIVHHADNYGIVFTDGGVWLFDMDDYGRKWRCWTSRPTDEQREATPWNVQK